MLQITPDVIDQFACATSSVGALNVISFYFEVHHIKTDVLWSV